MGSRNLGPTLTVEVDGFETLRANIREFEDGVQKRVLAQAAMAGIKGTFARAQDLVPKATHDYEGTVVPRLLHDSLYVVRGKRSNENRGFAFLGIRKLSIKLVKEFVRTTGMKSSRNPRDPWYWKVFEFGKLKRTTHPFIRPAFEQTKHASMQFMRMEARRLVDKEHKRLAKVLRPRNIRKPLA